MSLKKQLEVLLPVLVLCFSSMDAAEPAENALCGKAEQYRLVAVRASEDHQDPDLADYWLEQEKAIDRVYKEARSRCTPDDVTGATEFVIEISQDGTLSQVFVPTGVDRIRCGVDKLIGMKLGAPPRAPVYLRMFTSALIICPGVPDE